MKTIYGLVIIFLLVLGVGFALAHEGNTDLNHHGMMSGFYGGALAMGFFGWVFMILILVALVLFIVWLIKQIQEPPKKRRRK